MNTQNLKWGIIGCGNVTEVKSGPAYQLVENFDLHAVSRRNVELGEDYAKRHGVKKFYSDPESLIFDDEIDCVYIATPPDSHKKFGLLTASAGKPCCIEKPLAPSFQDCVDIHQAFVAADVPLFVAYYRRSLPRFKKIQSLLADQAIGKIRHVSWSLSKPADKIDLADSYNWRTDHNVAPGGYFDDLASHGLDLISYLLGNVKEVRGVSTNQQQLYSAKDAVSACWLHESGLTGSGYWNFGSYKAEDKVTILGDKGEIHFAVFDEAPIVLETRQQCREFHIANPKHIQLNHVQDIRDHLFDGRRHPSMGESAVHVSWIMDAILGRL
ncbi:Gfo/Idh/MocA family protein [Veronia pacifica]|uniref:Oxidoreductase n=1 Tax=Veronia pacifica TaxID=1080227 RepID=A0A1C3ELD7_9GAMM|nr:Gfo/Idh/MocA family oxidoreductase [Veronia pacifica]ODA34042.1 oxidoreductase [Veronia pacifica]